MLKHKRSENGLLLLPEIYLHFYLLFNFKNSKQNFGHNFISFTTIRLQHRYHRYYGLGFCRPRATRLTFV